MKVLCGSPAHGASPLGSGFSWSDSLWHHLSVKPVVVLQRKSCTWLHRNIFRLNQANSGHIRQSRWNLQTDIYFIVEIWASSSEFFFFSSSISCSVSAVCAATTWSVVTGRAFALFCRALFSCSSLHKDTNICPWKLFLLSKSHDKNQMEWFSLKTIHFPSSLSFTCHRGPWECAAASTPFHFHVLSLSVNSLSSPSLPATSYFPPSALVRPWTANVEG